MGRREQLGIDSAKLDKAFKAVTDRPLKRAAAEIFAPARHAGAFVTVKKESNPKRRLVTLRASRG